MGEVTMVTSLLKSLMFNYGVIWKKHTRLSCCQSPKLALFFEARKTVTCM